MEMEMEMETEREEEERKRRHDATYSTCKVGVSAQKQSTNNPSSRIHPRHSFEPHSFRSFLFSSQSFGRGAVDGPHMDYLI
jgi:hypothetical protein